jgi:hypothetical protein
MRWLVILVRIDSRNGAAWPQLARLLAANSLPSIAERGRRHAHFAAFVAANL